MGTKSALVLDEQGDDAEQPVPEVECDWRIRIGSLLPGRDDVWWQMRAGMGEHELDALAETVTGALTTVAVPELERMADDVSILRSVRPSERAAAPFALDIAAPILRTVGPPHEYKTVLADIDALGDRALALFEPTGSGGRRLSQRRIDAYVADLASRNWGTRSFAASELRMSDGSAPVVAALRRALDDPIKYVRGHAAQSLGHLGDAQSSARLITMLETDRSPHASVGAGIGLMRLADRLSARDRARTIDSLTQRREAAAGTHRAAYATLLTEAGVPES